MQIFVFGFYLFDLYFMELSFFKFWKLEFKNTSFFTNNSLL